MFINKYEIEQNQKSDETVLIVKIRGIVVRHVKLDPDIKIYDGCLLGDNIILVGVRYEDNGNEQPIIVRLNSSFQLEVYVSVDGFEDCRLSSVKVDRDTIYAIGNCNSRYGIEYCGIIIQFDEFCNVINFTKHAVGKYSVFTTIDSIVDSEEYIYGQKQQLKTITVSGEFFSSEYHSGKFKASFDGRLSIMHRASYDTSESDFLKECITR